MSYHVFSGTREASPSVIYLIDSPEHPTVLDMASLGINSTVVRVPIDNWGARLTPWPATALYRGEDDYAGQAAETLSWLLESVLPTAEAEAGIKSMRRAIAGYSLAGLFSLYAFLHEPSFAAVACLSGSLWYEGWLEHLEALTLAGVGATRYAYFSLGSKEKRASRPALKTVEERTHATIELLEAQGITTDFVLHPGGHLTHINERTQAGLQALDTWLTAATSS